MARLKNPGKAQQTAPQPQTGPADATYTIVDVHNVSHSVIRQVEWLEQEIQAATNRVLQLEDEGDTDGEAPVQGAAAHEGNTDSQRQLIPVWLGDLRLTLSDDSQKLVYAIERVRIPQLHRKDIIGSRIKLSNAESCLEMLMITPKSAKITEFGSDMDLPLKLQQLKDQLA